MDRFPWWATDRELISPSTASEDDVGCVAGVLENHWPRGACFSSSSSRTTERSGAPGRRPMADRPVVALVGDGGLMFTPGEMASAAEAQARVILLTHDNGGYGEIRSAMLAAGVAPLGVDLTVPDLPAIAAACGWAVARPETPAAMLEAVRKAAGRQGPTMIRFDDRLREAWRP